VLRDPCKFGTVDQFGFQQTPLEAGCCFTLALTTGTDERIAPQVADSEANQWTQLGIIDADVASTSFLPRTGVLDIE
jgi:hypothetical protein